MTATRSTTTYEYDVPVGELSIRLPSGGVVAVHAFEVLEDHEGPGDGDTWVSEVYASDGHMFLRIQFRGDDPEVYEPFLSIHRAAVT